MPRASSSAIVSVLIMPRSATTHIRPMPKRSRSRVMTGNRAFTSVALPGQVSEQIGLPSASITTPTITCLSSARWSFDLPCCPRPSPPAP